MDELSNRIQIIEQILMVVSCVVSCRAVLCGDVLRRVVSCCIAPCRVVLCCVAPCRVVLSCVVLRRVVSC
jgi:hypothetical protein